MFAPSAASRRGARADLARIGRPAAIVRKPFQDRGVLPGPVTAVALAVGVPFVKHLHVIEHLEAL
jgi:hypothetical protein